MKFFWLVAVASLVSSVAIPAQADTGEQTPEATQVEKTMNQLAADIQDADAVLEEAVALHAELVKAAEKNAIETIEKEAKARVAEGDLPGAFKAWEQVLKIDTNNADARAFFELIKRLDVIKRIESQAKSKPTPVTSPKIAPAAVEPVPKNPIATIAGKWTVVFGTTGSRQEHTIDEKGMIDGSPLMIHEGRILWKHSSEDREIIPSGNRLIVLAWSRSKGKNALTPPTTIRGVPNHVGIAHRTGG